MDRLPILVVPPLLIICVNPNNLQNDYGEMPTAICASGYILQHQTRNIHSFIAAILNNYQVESLNAEITISCLLPSSSPKHRALIIFEHGSGSGKGSPRHMHVVKVLRNYN